MDEPPRYDRAPIRGAIAFAWWALRLYVLAMTALVILGFAHGLR